MCQTKLLCFTREPLNFVSYYLSARVQRVVSGDRVSSIAAVTSRVSQGSILGPLLFVLYTADILNNIKICSSNAYADDTQLRYAFFTSLMLLSTL